MILDSIQIVGVWTHLNKSPNFGYIGQLWKYLQLNKQRLSTCIVAGDFNSNTIWDEWDRWWNHSDVVRELDELNVRSIYHELNGEGHGKESAPTFYLHKNAEKPYHIDYCFASTNLLNKVDNFRIGKFAEWKHLSDHCPLVLNFSLE
jgi:endonuclease/exonuclease/phosphatase family metal-dependent hydrolase